LAGDTLKRCITGFLRALSNRRGYCPEISLSIKKVFTCGVYAQCAEVVNLFYLFLEAGAGLHRHHDRYSHQLDPVLYDEDRDLVQGLFYE
jgi:hypothetical protein